MKKFNHNSGKHLDIDGAKIYYETSGGKSSPALLFLHGGFGTMEDFNDVISELEKDYRIIGMTVAVRENLRLVDRS